MADTLTVSTYADSNAIPATQTEAMFGKHFASMYTGSMFGSGAITFAVMGYVIANAQPDARVGTQVELNPALLAAIFGEQPKDVESAIEKLCSPDPKSRSEEHQGRRLIKLGQFDYQVVNGAKYRAIRDEEQRRVQNREAQRRRRIRKTKGKPLPGEKTYEQEQDDRIVTSNLPEHLQETSPHYRTNSEEKSQK